VNVPRNDRFTLVEALDRLIDKGVSVSGDVSISVADVDLVYVGLRVLLASADDVPALRRIRAAGAPADAAGGAVGTAALPRDAAGPPPPQVAAAAPAPSPPFPTAAPAPAGRQRDVIHVGEPTDEEPRRLLDISPEQIERDLCRLVLTVVELLRQLMEKQAMRRMEGGSLRDEEVERLGTAFERLDAKMEELKALFGLDAEDLNIDLGPLGTLV
jgi:hypothetical protein